ncbi:uncharacterized protein Dana_GF21079, isoform B [Drosophila ananassae]|uniref:Uncharacterized protein, isoform B n=1 Tax=Drosophila ananassae TaxID=7217 RepID=A0A0P8XJN1_DROAN|nr:uncharacterized protein LOC6503768 isoform X2 [Drosophila ananassae]KPU75031.1 uncharacterized protein Dana_GF21079, isoform B [Drosophila ananassae]
MSRPKPIKIHSGVWSYAATVKEESDVACLSWRSTGPTAFKPPVFPAWSGFSGGPSSYKPPDFPAWGGFSGAASARASYSARVATEMEKENWKKFYVFDDDIANEPYFASNLKYYPHLPQPLWVDDYQTFAEIKASISAGNHSQIRPPLSLLYVPPRPSCFGPGLNRNGVMGHGPFLGSRSRDDWFRMGCSPWRPFEVKTTGDSLSRLANLMRSARVALPEVMVGQAAPNQGAQLERRAAAEGGPRPLPGPSPAAAAGAPEPREEEVAVQKPIPVPPRIPRYNMNRHRRLQSLRNEAAAATATIQTTTAYSLNLSFEVTQSEDSPFPIIKDNGTLIRPLPPPQFRLPPAPKKDEAVDAEVASTSAKFVPVSSPSSSPLMFPPFE